MTTQNPFGVKQDLDGLALALTLQAHYRAAARTNQLLAEQNEMLRRAAMTPQQRQAEDQAIREAQRLAREREEQERRSAEAAERTRRQLRELRRHERREWGRALPGRAARGARAALRGVAGALRGPGRAWRWLRSITVDLNVMG